MYISPGSQDESIPNFGQAPNPVTWVLTRERQREMWELQRGRQWGDGGRDWGDAPTRHSRKDQELPTAVSQQQLAEKHGTDSASASRRNRLCQHLEVGLRPPELWENKFLLLSAPTYDVICYSSHRKVIFASSWNVLVHLFLVVRTYFSFKVHLWYSCQAMCKPFWLSPQPASIPASSVSLSGFAPKIHLSICYPLF